MKVVRISFETLQQLLKLKKHLLVGFVSSWTARKARKAYPAFDVHDGDIIFEVSVEIGTASEDYVVDYLKVAALPVLALFANGALWKAYEFDAISDLRRTLEGLQDLLSVDRLMKYDPLLDIDVISSLLSPPQDAPAEPVFIFVSGDRSSVGKSTTCLALLSSLLRRGIPPSALAYIKPVTQCEAHQPVVTFCENAGISHRGIGPVVFYKGFTRAYLAGETESSEQLVQSAVDSVVDIGRGKRFVLVDGVGYPSVGSICNISNATTARALRCPVLLVGKEGVGDAVDSFNMNAAVFEVQAVPVLGGIFNKLPLTGFYSREACQTAVTSYFSQFRPHQMPYGFVPAVTAPTAAAPTATMEVDSSIPEPSREAVPVVATFEDVLTDTFLQYVDLDRLVYDTWMFNRVTKNMGAVETTQPSQPAVARHVPSVATAVTPVSHSRPEAVLPAPKVAKLDPLPMFVAPAALGEPVVRAASGVKRSRAEVEQGALEQGARGG